MTKKISLIVADIKVTYRTVEVPKKCPHCKARLEIAGVRSYEYLDVAYDGGIGSDGKFDQGDQGFEWYGDDMISGVAYYCGKCKGTIAEGVRTTD